MLGRKRNAASKRAVNKTRAAVKASTTPKLKIRNKATGAVVNDSPSDDEEHSECEDGSSGSSSDSDSSSSGSDSDSSDFDRVYKPRTRQTGETADVSKRVNYAEDSSDPDEAEEAFSTQNASGKFYRLRSRSNIHMSCSIAGCRNNLGMSPNQSDGNAYGKYSSWQGCRVRKCSMQSLHGRKRVCRAVENERVLH